MADVVVLACARLQDPEASAAAERSRMTSQVMEEVKSFFRPELLNRFDEQVSDRPGGRDAQQCSLASALLRLRLHSCCYA